MQNTEHESYDKKTLQVAIAVIPKARQFSPLASASAGENLQILLSKRHANVHQGDLWEFPGGKLKVGESALQAIKREIQEELGLEVLQAHFFHKLIWDYSECTVILHVFLVEHFCGLPEGREGQEVFWGNIGDLQVDHFPAANRSILRKLQLPSHYAITPEPDPHTETSSFLKYLEILLQSGVKLVQWRYKHTEINSRLVKLALLCRKLCWRYDAKILLNVPDALRSSFDIDAFDGIHLDSHALKQCSNTSIKQYQGNNRLLGASCHDEEELALANSYNLDYVLLSPVLKTATHPEANPLGWKHFALLCKSVQIPVYALGGMRADDTDLARSLGGQGIAGISVFWPDKKI